MFSWPNCLLVGWFCYRRQPVVPLAGNSWPLLFEPTLNRWSLFWLKHEESITSGEPYIRLLLCNPGVWLILPDTSVFIHDRGWILKKAIRRTPCMHLDSAVKQNEFSAVRIIRIEVRKCDSTKQGGFFRRVCGRDRSIGRKSGINPGVRSDGLMLHDIPSHRCDGLLR